jgi:hypothetical protein
MQCYREELTIFQRLIIRIKSDVFRPFLLMYRIK